MPLIKSCNGLLEDENYYLTSNAIDFLENTNYYIIDNKFFVHEGTIERNLLYNEFVIELKEMYEPKYLEDTAFLYISNGKRFGILEKYENLEEANYCYWKTIYYDGFLQTYKSVDGHIWENIGGAKIKNVILQGFKVTGNTPFIFENYKVYKNPYITINNYPNNFRIELLDEANNIVKQKSFENNKCKIFLDYCFLGKIRIFDTNNTIINTTSLIALNYGDEFSLSNYDIEMYYENTKFNYTDTNLIKKFLDKVIIKNISNDIYTNLKLSVSKPINNIDNIKLSLDGINFFDILSIDKLISEESKDIYIKILTDNSTNNIRYKNFSIDIV